MERSKMWKRKKSVIAIVVLAMILTLSLAFVFVLTPSNTTYAARGVDDDWVTVGEIYDDGTQSFDSAKLMDLIEKLIGERSYNNLKTAVGGVELPGSKNNSKTSASFREANGGKNVSVYFGGIKWDAVYLTEAKTTSGDTEEGDIILDLWRSADELTSPSNKPYKASSDEAPYLLNWSYNSTGYNYPSNMYSTSNIRVEILNAGGQYSTSGSALKVCEQSANHQYARFTMSMEQGVENSLTKYLAKPSEVGYQEIEYDSETMQSFYGPKYEGGYQTDVKYYYFPNDAYGEPSGGEWYKDGIDMGVYSTKGNVETAYDAWKDDYLWLPSLTETGMSNGNVSSIGDGIWDTDASLRSAKSGVGNGSCWLRSGAYWCANRAYLLDTSGNYSLLVVNNLGRGVRPAIHFNLSAAARSATPDKDRWKGDTKPYSPDGVTWKIENTDVVEITAVANGESGDTSWYDKDKHTITAKKVGNYQIQVKPSTDFHWKDGSDDVITVTYTVEPADMTVTFNNGASGAFNNGRLEQKREFVYSLSMDPIALKLPDPTDPKFPINWKGVTWYPETISKLEIQYIVQKYEEAEPDKAMINNYLNGLKDNPPSADWKDYENLGDDQTAQAPKYYVVYFKATDTDGNHNPCYGYFEIHIAVEELTITLSEAARTGFAKGVEYGDVAHTKADFEQDILAGIQKVIGKLNTDKTKEFKDKIEDYTFYLRKDNSIQGSVVQDDGDIYTVEDDGIHLQNGSQKVENLPLGTYHLYVGAVDKNTSNYLTFAWADGRPSFEVKARKINVTLTFEEGATYGDAHTGWVTATASRAGGAEGSWYAQNEADGDDDLAILDLSYTLQGMSGVPSISTSAGTYPVTPTCSNTNYDVEFVGEHSGTAFEYTIAKAPLTVTANDKAITYGDEPSNDGVTYSGFVNGEKESDLSGALTFNYGEYEAYEDVGEYVIKPSGLSSDNYDITFENGTLTVGQKEIEVKWSEKNYTYAGVAFNELPTATADGIGEDGTFTLLVALSDSAQIFKDAGGYAFKAALDSEDAKTKNYTLNENTKTRAYIVEKQVVVAPTIASKVYNGVTHTAEVEVSALFSVNENNGGINAGDYEVKLALQHPENYKWATSDDAEIILIFTITKADYVMSGVTFEDVTVDYDGQAHSITIKGDLPNGVTVTYDGNDQKAVGKYTVTATFNGDAQNYNSIEPMTAILTILSNGNLVTRHEYTFPGSKLPNVIVESADGFDPALKLICDGADNITRTFLAWKKDEISGTYIVKLMKDGEAITLDGKVTVRLLIPEELRNKDFTLKSADGVSVEYTRDGDYVIFEADGLSAYTFMMDGVAYLPILLAAAAISLLCMGTLIVLAIVIKKNKKGDK